MRKPLCFSAEISIVRIRQRIAVCAQNRSQNCSEKCLPSFPSFPAPVFVDSNRELSGEASGNEKDRNRIKADSVPVHAEVCVHCLRVALCYGVCGFIRPSNRRQLEATVRKHGVCETGTNKPEEWALGVCKWPATVHVLSLQYLRICEGRRDDIKAGNVRS
jgi:hypothetical protein